jgi:hypothetical protein
MKLKVEVEVDGVPTNCEFCRFCHHEDIEFGRHKKVKCILTGLGDSHCEWESEVHETQRVMLAKCPFNKYRG